jgi:hypothetical protein
MAVLLNKKQFPSLGGRKAVPTLLNAIIPMDWEVPANRNLNGHPENRTLRF